MFIHEFKSQRVNGICAGESSSGGALRFPRCVCTVQQILIKYRFRQELEKGQDVWRACVRVPHRFLPGLIFPWILSSTASSMVTICVGIATVKHVCSDADIGSADDAWGSRDCWCWLHAFLGRWPVTCCAESSGSCTWARGCRVSCRGAAGRLPRPLRASVSSVRTPFLHHTNKNEL